MGVEAGPRWREHQCLSLEWEEAQAGGWLVGRGRVPSGATMARQGDQLVLLLLFLGAATIEATQKVNTTEIRLESGSGLKSYEEEEEGTVLPYRTFLTTVEIIIICVVTVIVFVLTALLVIYLCVYGCVLPECCKRKNKEYTPVMLERERKTTEIWKQNHTRASGGVQKLDSVA